MLLCCSEFAKYISNLWKAVLVYNGSYICLPVTRGNLYIGNEFLISKGNVHANRPFYFFLLVRIHYMRRLNETAQECASYKGASAALT